VNSGFQFSDEEEFTISDEYTEIILKDYLNQIYFRKKSLIMKKNDVEGTIGDPINIRTVYNLDDLLNWRRLC
jgi:hypothetical protein